MLRSETSLWKWLAKNEIARTQLHATRVENKAASGMPDVEGCFEGNQFWIELKIVKRPIKEHALIKVDHLRPKQVEWLYNRWLVGGNAWVLIRLESIVRPINQQYYLIPGKYVRELLTGLTERQLFVRSPLPSNPCQKEIIIEAATHRLKLK